MAGSDGITPSFPTPLETQILHPTVEPGDDSSDYLDLTPTLSASTTPTTPSSTTPSEIDQNEDMIEEILREATQVCRIDTAHELALSFFGLVPPKNFGRVMPGVYRSGFPQKENLRFLKVLGIKSILTLVPEEYSADHKQFVSENSINHCRVQIQPNKDPFVVVSQCTIANALSIVMDRSNYPLLIHCNKGKHRTGTVVGCLRKVQGWEMEQVLIEYRKYAGIKARILDERFMDMFDERALLWLARQNGLLMPDEPRTESPISSLTVSTRLRG